jgi:hypothetical protein
MIISASYKTDIPAFYGPWFMARLRAGFCRAVNAYNSKLQTVSLTKETVNGIVFWTKNVGPMMKYFPEVKEMGFPFFVQHTITGYPRHLETSVADATRAVGYVTELAKQFGKRSVVWRYDPILITDLTPADWHIANFSGLAARLSGLTDEVVVSFATFYKKTQRNLEKSARENGFTWIEPTRDQKKEMLTRYVEIAASYGMQLTVCAQPENMVPGAKEAHCIDAQRLADLSGYPIKAKFHGNRPGCACAEARDIGEYDTCPHGCVYCYAVQDRNLARIRHRKHDPGAEFLFPPRFVREGQSEITKQRLLF